MMRSRFFVLSMISLTLTAASSLLAQDSDRSGLVALYEFDEANGD